MHLTSMGKVQKNRKKLTNVSLYLCMLAENSKMLVLFLCFFPQHPAIVLSKLFNDTKYKGKVQKKI